MRRHLADHRSENPRVLVQEVHPAHAGLAREAGRDDDDVRPCRVRVVVGSPDVRLEALHRGRLTHVQGESLGQALDDVDHHDIVRQAPLHDPHGRGGADEPAPHDGDPHRTASSRPGTTSKKQSYEVERGGLRAGPGYATAAWMPACSSISVKSWGLEAAVMASSMLMKPFWTRLSSDWSNV